MNHGRRHRARRRRAPDRRRRPPLRHQAARPRRATRSGRSTGSPSRPTQRQHSPLAHWRPRRRLRDPPASQATYAPQPWSPSSWPPSPPSQARLGVCYPSRACEPTTVRTCRRPNEVPPLRLRPGTRTVRPGTRNRREKTATNCHRLDRRPSSARPAPRCSREPTTATWRNTSRRTRSRSRTPSSRIPRCL